MIPTNRMSRSLFAFAFAAFVVLWLTIGIVDAAVLAAALVVVACLDPKHAWKWFHDPPGTRDQGRDSGSFLLAKSWAARLTSRR